MSLVGALQQALAAEHRAVYLLEYAGGRAAAYVGKGLTKRLYTLWRDHQELRGWLEAAIADLGAQPVAAELTYSAPDVTTARQARSVARDAEHRCLIDWLAVVAEADPASEIRTKAMSVYTATALRELSFGAGPQALPGLRAASTAPGTVSPSPSSS